MSHSPAATAQHQNREFVKTTCPRDCYDACGIVAVRKDNTVLRVLGDQDHHVSKGALCGKCAIAYNGVWIDKNARLTVPLRRTGKKGDAKFERISWDAALAEIADRLASITRSTPERVIHTHYTGTCSLIAGNFPTRFFNYIGATEVDPDSVCNKAGHLVLSMMLGDSLDGFDPRSINDTNCVLIWGANPSSSAPHAHRHWLDKSWSKTICIDPIEHETAQKSKLYLKLKPGSDAALAFSLMHVAMQSGLLDQAFIEQHILGWEEIRDVVVASTPEKGEALTGVPAAKIVEAARMFAEGPSLMWLGQGMQRQRLGGNAFRAATAFAAITGNIGRAGAGLLYMNGFGTRGVDASILSRPDLASSPLNSISHMDLAEVLANRDRSAALFTWNNNILASSPRQNSLKEVLKREDLFTVVVDCFQTDTADLADIILPAASFLEFDDLVFSYFHHTISAQVKIADPMGEARPNQEIFRNLAQAMGLNHPDLYETDAELISKILAATGTEHSFLSLSKIGTAEVFDKPRVPFHDRKFSTPSGKIEIACDRALESGAPLVPFPHADTIPNLGRVRVLSPASALFMNSIYGNDPRLRERLGHAKIHISKADAENLGISDGMHVVLRNGEGELNLSAAISDQVQPGVVLVHKGPWPKYTLDQSNVNVLNGGEKSDFGESTAVHGIEAELVVVNG